MMVWPIVFLSLSLPLTIGLSFIWSTLFIDASMGLLHTCPNHLRQDSTIFSTVGVTSIFYNCTRNLVLSYTTTNPSKHYRLYNTEFTFMLALAAQHSALYSIASLKTVR